jgi:hypothetical protein
MYSQMLIQALTLLIGSGKVLTDAIMPFVIPDKSEIHYYLRLLDSRFFENEGKD